MELVLLLEKINAELGGQEDILLTQMLTKCKNDAQVNWELTAMRVKWQRRTQ